MDDGGARREAVVIGGGVAGMQAALSLAGMGARVHLVERSSALGGRALGHRFLYPSLAEPRGILKGMAAQVDSDPSISVYLNCVVSQVDRLERFEVELQSVPAEKGRGCVGAMALKADAIVVATGLDDVDAREIPELGYGRLANVVTAEDYERMLDPQGPSGGRVVRPSDSAEAGSVAFAQCIGSRVERRGVPYCSAVCCSNAIKDAIKLKEAEPNADVFVLYIDIRTHGKGTEALYRKAREKGVRFIRGQPSMVTAIPREQRVLVSGENTLLKELYEIPVDLLVLSVGLRQREDNRQLFDMLGVKLDGEGLVESAGPGTDSVLTSAPGVFVAGCAESPKDVRESLAQGRAAAAAAWQRMDGMLPKGSSAPGANPHDMRKQDDAQRERWNKAYGEPDFFGDVPSEFGERALGYMKGRKVRKVLELGCGQGRDTWLFLRNGLEVVALDYSEAGICAMRERAEKQGLDKGAVLQVADVRDGIPLPDGSVDAVYSHMFFTMELTEREIARILKECLRVLRPGGLNMYSVRNDHDPHYKRFTPKGEDMYENPMGFVVHFFTEEKVRRLSEGYQLLWLREFEDTSPPFTKKLYEVVLQKPVA